jgi:3D (Asp-Asp-Asp) domain-containing protein
MKISAWSALLGAVALSGGIVLAEPAMAAGHTMTFEATAYAPTTQDNYPYGPTDYFGRPLTAGDIAVDPSVIPLRTCVWVTGYSSPLLPVGGFVAQADDEGNAIQGRHIDIFMNTSEAMVNNFGIQTVKVTELGPANPHLAGMAGCVAYTGDSTGAVRQEPVSAAPTSAVDAAGYTVDRHFVPGTL